MTSEDFDTVTGADEDPNFEPTTAEGRHEALLWGDKACDARPRPTGRFLTDAPALTEAALADIGEERERQYAKWGPQHHPDGTGSGYPLQRLLTDEPSVLNLDFRTAQELAAIFRGRCDVRAAAGVGTWLDILFEEVYEAAAEMDPVTLRVELVQVAAVAAAWAEDIDSRG